MFAQPSGSLSMAYVSTRDTFFFSLPFPEVPEWVLKGLHIITNLVKNVCNWNFLLTNDIMFCRMVSFYIGKVFSSRWHYCHVDHWQRTYVVMCYHGFRTRHQSSLCMTKVKSLPSPPSFLTWKILVSLLCGFWRCFHWSRNVLKAALPWRWPQCLQPHAGSWP